MSRKAFGVEGSTTLFVARKKNVRRNLKDAMFPSGFLLTILSAVLISPTSPLPSH